MTSIFTRAPRDPHVTYGRPRAHSVNEPDLGQNGDDEMEDEYGDELDDEFDEDDDEFDDDDDWEEEYDEEFEELDGE